MMRRIRAAAFLATTVATAAGPASALSYVGLFVSEQLAQQHCPHDVIVWLDFQTGYYYLKGQGWSPTATRGAYACRGEAETAGARPGAGHPPT